MTPTKRSPGAKLASRSTRMLTAAVVACATLIAAPTAAHATGPSSVTPETTTVRFDSTTGTDWAPPAGVSTIHVTLAGGAGADITHQGVHTGAGRSGLVEFDLAVSGTDRFRAYAATRGGSTKTQNAGAGYLSGGAGGAGNGAGTSGGGGGGAAALIRNDQVVAVAGGGGGAGGSVKATPTLSNPTLWLFGGAGGWGTSGADRAGEKGTAGSHPGNGGSAGTVTGTSGTAGSKAATLTSSGGGGGGGGGWPSGNGGQSGKKAMSHSTGGGGAGGTSFVSDAASNVSLRTLMDSDGYVEITYTNPVRMQLATAKPFVAGVEQTLETTLFGAAGVPVKPGKVMLTAGTTFLGYDETVDGRVDFWFDLPEGTHTLTAAFTSFDRTQRVTGTLEVTVLAGAEHTVTSFRYPPTRVLAGSTFSLSGHVHVDGDLDISGETVAVSVDGAVTTLPLRADGGFGGEFTAPSDARPFAVRAVFSGGSAFQASETPELTLEAFQYAATAQLTVSATQLSFGEPLSATVTVNGQVTAPTGAVELSDGTGVIANAQLANRTATFTDLALPVGATELTATYHGNSVYGEAVSSPVRVDVVPVGTTTELTATSASGLAGDPVEVAVRVAAQVPSSVEPRGTVEIRRGDEVLAVLAAGDDADVTAGDGVSVYRARIAEPGVGEHSFTAHFVPAPGYEASASDPQVVALVAHGTITTLDSQRLTVAPGAATTVRASITVLDEQGKARSAEQLGRLGLSQLSGTVYALVNDEPLGDPVHLEAPTAAVDITLPELGAGQHRVAVMFQPDSASFTASSAQLELVVSAGTDSVSVAPNASSAGQAAHPPTSLASTGSEVGLWVPAAVIGALLVVAATAIGVRAQRRR